MRLNFSKKKAPKKKKIGGHPASRRSKIRKKRKESKLTVISPPRMQSPKWGDKVQSDGGHRTTFKREETRTRKVLENQKNV